MDPTKTPKIRLKVSGWSADCHRLIDRGAFVESLVDGFSEQVYRHEGVGYADAGRWVFEVAGVAAQRPSRSGRLPVPALGR